MQDPAVLGYLGRALSLELSAVQQYLALARLLELRGMPQAGGKFRHEAQEEMEHAERIIGRMLALGAAPNASCLRPCRLDGALPQLLKHAGDLETEIIGFYTQAVQYCVRTQDHENRVFFETLLREEQSHGAEIDAWRQRIMAGQPIGEEPGHE